MKKKSPWMPLVVTLSTCTLLLGGTFGIVRYNAQAEPQEDVTQAVQLSPDAIPFSNATKPVAAELPATQTLLTHPDLLSLPSAPEGKLTSTPLQPGDIAPDFVLPDQKGQRHRLSDLRGKTVVLSFYPQDLTFSCVSEAVSFSEKLPAFYAHDAIVFGVSVQSVFSKALFANRFDIRYPLLADSTQQVTRDYRVMTDLGTASRVTFVIGPDGRILSTDQKVRATTHASDVLSALDKLESPLFLKPLNSVNNFSDFKPPNNFLPTNFVQQNSR